MDIHESAQAIWDYYRPTVKLIRLRMVQCRVPYRSHVIVVAPTDRFQSGSPKAYVEIQAGTDTIRVFPNDVVDPPEVSPQVEHWLVEWLRHNSRYG